MKRPLSAPRKSNELKKYAAAAIAGGFVSTVLARNFFEYEKKITHPILVDYDVSDPQFRQTLSQLLGPPLVEGNSVTILENGAEIFDAMVAGIKLAQRTITFENFVFTHGRITRRFAEALVGRARKGVKVHFLQDAMGCDCVHGGEMRLLQDAGCEVEIFRYLNLRFNERTHRKLLIIDGKVGFIGGVGISDAWDGHADAPNRWRDTQYRVEGPVV
ncbi:MAG: phospholipase D-like domain-containing protein, partial [Prosthecobacter sp.]|nr:phospholipase D-like domain-containing protein [Prosthecobacter sp.]